VISVVHTSKVLQDPGRPYSDVYFSSAGVPSSGFTRYRQTLPCSTFDYTYQKPLPSKTPVNNLSLARSSSHQSGKEFRVMLPEQPPVKAADYAITIDVEDYFQVAAF
jgi:hypothetical protein